MSAAGDGMRAAKQLEVTGEAGEQFDSWRKLGHLSAAQSCAAEVAAPWAVVVAAPGLCWSCLQGECGAPKQNRAFFMSIPAPVSLAQDRKCLCKGKYSVYSLSQCLVGSFAKVQ